MRYLYKKIVPTIYKKIPKKFCNFDLSSLLTVLAPTLAINMVIGINIKKAGIFMNPTLNGKSAFKKEPEIKKPIVPNKEITEPMAAALPIALLIG